MDSVFWYLDASGARRGPFDHDQIVAAIREGAIAHDTAVWDSSLNDWRPAASIADFSGLFGGAAPGALASSVPPAPPRATTPWAGALPLAAAIPVWGLFWRAVLAAFGNLLVVPTPWTFTAYARFVASRVSLPNGVPLRFVGRPGDIWLVLVVVAILGLIGQYHHLAIVAVPVSYVLQTYILRWICAKMTAADGSLRVAFEGHVLGLLGWGLLFMIAFVTIVGWAWVVTATMRWICRNVRGTHRFAYTATGWDVLWRGFVFVLLAILIIPIPWLVRWLAVWSIAKIEVIA